MDSIFYLVGVVVVLLVVAGYLGLVVRDVPAMSIFL